MSEIFRLKWYDYQSNWNKALNELREDTDSADVTLISDDKVKFSAHKIILSSCSNLFRFILKGNVQANSLMYLSGVKSQNLGFILDYIYHGEVNIYQDQLDSFLECAQKLEIEGLLGNTEYSHENMNEGKHLPQEPELKIEKYEQDEEKTLLRMDIEERKRRPHSKTKNEVAMIDVGSMTSEEIDNKMRELYEKTEEGWRCLVCDQITNKHSKSSSMRRHVETHMDGLVYTCNLCSKEFRSRNVLSHHKRSYCLSPKRK